MLNDEHIVYKINEPFIYNNLCYNCIFDYLYLQYCIFKEDNTETAFAKSLIEFFTMEEEMLKIEEENKENNERKTMLLLKKQKEIENFENEKKRIKKCQKRHFKYYIK